MATYSEIAKLTCNDIATSFSLENKKASALLWYAKKRTSSGNGDEQYSPRGERGNAGSGNAKQATKQATKQSILSTDTQLLLQACCLKTDIEFSPCTVAMAINTTYGHATFISMYNLLLSDDQQAQVKDWIHAAEEKDRKAQVAMIMLDVDKMNFAQLSEVKDAIARIMRVVE